MTLLCLAGYGAPLGAAESPTDARISEGFVALKRGFSASAYEMFLQAANDNHPQAQYLVGRMLEGGEGVPRKMLEAVAWYRKAAEHGIAEAKARLGFLYWSGQGVPEDHKEAFKWFLDAAEKGDQPLAQTYLCTILDQGAKTIPADRQQALGWCRRAAENGEPAAQAMMGFRYAEGDGVDKDLETAHFWFTMAASGGNHRAQDALRQLEPSMTQEQIARARKRTGTELPKPPPDPLGVRGKK
ncbi:MAG: sel1 repeat family protein [Magnetococcales bacterium]|nr:sel1 repeat family protein [Magnetococcales bacterium]